MLRRSTPPHSRSTLLLMVLTIALPTQAARSQDRAMQDRLDRLERDLSMLQRQVYRSAGGSVVPAGSKRCGRQRTSHGSDRDADARADRPGRGCDEWGRAVAAALGANKQRHRCAIWPRPRPAGTPAAPFDRRRGGRQRGGRNAPGPGCCHRPRARHRWHRTTPLCRREPWCLRRLYTPTGLGTLTPPKSPGGPQPFAPEPENGSNRRRRPSAFFGRVASRFGFRAI